MRLDVDNPQYFMILYAQVWTTERKETAMARVYERTGNVHSGGSGICRYVGSVPDVALTDYLNARAYDLAQKHWHVRDWHNPAGDPASREIRAFNGYTTNLTISALIGVDEEDGFYVGERCDSCDGMDRRTWDEPPLPEKFYRIRLYDELGDYTTPRAVGSGYDNAVSECVEYTRQTGLRACVVRFDGPYHTSRVLFDSQPGRRANYGQPS